MLLEHHGRRQHRLETVGGLMSHDTAKAAERCRTSVVWQRVEESLHINRRAEPLDQRALTRRERQ